jgi:hypothetical protein
MTGSPTRRVLNAGSAPRTAGTATRTSATSSSVVRIRSTGISASRSTASATDPKIRRPRPPRPWVDIAMRSAPASRAAATISWAGSPLRTSVATRTPLFRSSIATGARYSCASIRSATGSPAGAYAAPPTTTRREGLEDAEKDHGSI